MKSIGYSLFFFLSLGIFFGCGSTSSLQSSLGNKYRYYYSLVEPQKSADLLFRDRYLIIQFRFDDAAIKLQAQNISAVDMRIDWANATISAQGRQFSIRNLNVLYTSSAVPTPSLIIPPLGVIRDIMIPASHVLFRGSERREVDLLPTTDRHSARLRDSIRSIVGSTIEVTLPIQLDSLVKTYQFRFSVDSVQQIDWAEYQPPNRFPVPAEQAKVRPGSNDQITAAILVTGFLGFSAYMLTAKKVPPSE